ncbi:hypothetical protein [Hyalangium versicolor]|uniref:hypothetical protein n=1 Tax=Hyalangium versicolor TaxID=2861190 RepID=UPI001CD01CB1|nr:hypothetical protein [Hyalangium versicolor]
MSHRRGGFELAERQEGMRALREARSPEALAKLLDELPVLHDPVFHQDVVRLLSQELPEDERLSGVQRRHGGNLDLFLLE